MKRMLVQEHLKKYIEELFDEDMRKFNFIRRKNSLFYKLEYDELTHHIFFYFDVSPRFNPNGAFLHPSYILHSPKISDMALKLLNGDKSLLADHPEIIITQQLSSFVNYTQSLEVDLNLNETDRETLTNLRYIYIDKIVPRLFAINSIQKFVDSIISSDNFSISHHAEIFIIAAYLLLNQKENAIKYANDKYSSKRDKRIYQMLFDNLDNMC